MKSQQLGHQEVGRFASFELSSHQCCEYTLNFFPETSKERSQKCQEGRTLKRFPLIKHRSFLVNFAQGVPGHIPGTPCRDPTAAADGVVCDLCRWVIIRGLELIQLGTSWTAIISTLW